MDRQEHIHIIGAGEEIGAACAAAIRDLQDITRIFVFADSELYSNSSRDDERTKAHKTAVRVAVNGTKALAASLKIPASLVYIDPPASGTVAAAVQKIKSGYPGARCTFDLSGGSKDLSLALFQVSLWLEGDAYYAYAGPRGAGPSEKLAVPKIPLRDIAANPNYLRILTVLSDPPGKAETAPRILPRSVPVYPAGTVLCAGPDKGRENEYFDDKNGCHHREAGGDPCSQPRDVFEHDEHACQR